MQDNLMPMPADEHALVVKPDNTIQTISLDDIDQLDTAAVAPVDLMSDYWSPEQMYESKKVMFDRIEVTPVLDQNTGEVMEMDCAYFFVKEQGTVKRIRNGSKRLVGAIKSFGVTQGTPLLITYMGKKSNKTNQFKSDNWSVKPLIVNVTAKQPV